MKKIRILLALFVFLLALSVSAVSLNELETNKGSFVKIKTYPDATYYGNVDNHVIYKVEKPRYLINTYIYAVYPEERYIAKYDISIFYNTDTGEMSFKNFGMEAFEYNGQLAGTVNEEGHIINITPDHYLYDYALYVFGKVYNQI